MDNTQPIQVGPMGPLAVFPTFPSRVLIVLDDPCQAEVSNLTYQGCRDQDVGSTEISVNIVPLLDEGHAFCNLHPKQREIPSSSDLAQCKVDPTQKQSPSVRK